MPTQLKIVPTAAEALKTELYEQIRFNSDAQKKLPFDFMQVAADVIISKSTSVDNKYAFTAETDREKRRARQAFERQSLALTEQFMATDFISTDISKPDEKNGGQLLKITIDLDNAPISDNIKPFVREAIRDKITWMGYEQGNAGHQNMKKIMSTYMNMRMILPHMIF